MVVIAGLVNNEKQLCSSQPSEALYFIGVKLPRDDTTRPKQLIIM